jgi:hypothetical protein
MKSRKSVKPSEAPSPRSRVEQLKLSAMRLELCEAAIPAQWTLTFRSREVAKTQRLYFELFAAIEASGFHTMDEADLEHLQAVITRLEARLVAFHAKKRGAR